MDKIKQAVFYTSTGAFCRASKARAQQKKLKVVLRFLSSEHGFAWK
jgi:hypothetical protein